MSTSFDTQLTALNHVTRRRLLLTLLRAKAQNDLPVDVDQLEYDTAEHSFRLSMHHVHLPKLHDYGFVDANLDRFSVTTGPRFPEITPLLELLDANRDLLPDDLL